MNTKELIKRAHDNAIKKGFYDCPECRGTGQLVSGKSVFECESCDALGLENNRNIGEMLMLIITEMSEAVEAHRKAGFALLKEYEKAMKKGEENKKSLQKKGLYREYEKQVYSDFLKNTFEMEIADVFIRLFDLCGYLRKKELFYTGSSLIKSLVKRNISNYYYNIIKIFPRENDSDALFKAQLDNIYSEMINFCYYYGINIELYIELKMKYNETREYKHGKKY